MPVLFAIAAIFLFFYLARLSARITALEKQQNTQQQPTQPPVGTIAAQQPAATPTQAQPLQGGQTANTAEMPHAQASVQQPLARSVQQSATPQPAGENVFIAWVKEDFLVKLGSFLLLLAVGWFVSFAFSNGWIGPVGQIALGLLLGAVFLALGVWRIKTYVHQGSIFTVLGSTIVLIVVFAAREVYDFFTPSTALAVMFLSTVFVSMVAVLYKNRALAVAGLMLALAAPLFTVAPQPDLFGLLAYVLVVVIGNLWVTYTLRGYELPLLSLVGIVFYTVPFLMSAATESTALVFAVIFTAVLFFGNIAAVLAAEKENELQVTLPMLTTLGAGLYLVFWTLHSIPDELQSFVLLAAAATLGVVSFLIFATLHKRGPFYLYGSLGLGLVAVATAVELSGDALTIAYITEVTLVFLVARFAFAVRGHSLQRLSWLMIGPLLLSGSAISSRLWNDGAIHSASVTLLLLVMMCAMAAVIFADEDDNISDMYARVLAILAGAYAAGLVWLGTHAMLGDQLATTVSLVLFTITGIGLYVGGVVSASVPLRYVGVMLIGVTIARLLLVDVWQMDTVGRIVTFSLVGLLLISTAFLRRPKEDSVTPSV